MVNSYLVPDLFRLARQPELEGEVLLLLSGLAYDHAMRMQMLENRFFDFALGFLFHESL